MSAPADRSSLYRIATASGPITVLRFALDADGRVVWQSYPVRCWYHRDADHWLRYPLVFDKAHDAVIHVPLADGWPGAVWCYEYQPGPRWLFPYDRDCVSMDEVYTHAAALLTQPVERVSERSP
jgi:hypothetical protein